MIPKLKEMSFRNKVLINVGIIFLSLVVFSSLFYWFTGDVEEKAEEIAADKIFVSKQGQSISLLADLKHTEPIIDAYQDKLQSLMPTKDELINFPKWMESAANAHGVSASVSFQGLATPPDGSRPGFVNFELQSNGQLDKLVEFYKEIETGSSRFMLVIDNFDINAGDNSYRISSLGKVYYK